MLACDLMTKDIETCRLEDTAAHAAMIMQSRNCGFVPVVSDLFSETVVGVITDRDLALYMAKTNKRPGQIRVKEFYTRNPKTVYEDMDIQEVECMMEEFHIHRVPVLDRENRLVGVISLKDLAEEAWKEKDVTHPCVSDRDIAAIVETISLAP